MCKQTKEKVSFTLIEESAEALQSAGIGIKALANLLGADSDGPALDDKDKFKIAHAVVALGHLVLINSSDIYTAALEARGVE